jgi:uncharacterized membrane protein
MGLIEDIFGMDENRKIYRQEFETALKSLPNISHEEMEYLEGVFADALKDGITETELKKEILELKHNTSDNLDAIEVESVKRKLFGELEDNK